MFLYNENMGDMMVNQVYLTLTNYDWYDIDQPTETLEQLCFKLIENVWSGI